MERTRDILLVDETRYFRELGALFLARAGSVRTAASCDAALRAAREARPDVIVTDLDVVDIRGTDLCSLLRRDAALADIPVVATVGGASPHDHARAIQAGATDVVTRPLSRLALLESVARMTRFGGVRGQPRAELGGPVQVRQADRELWGRLRNVSRGGAFIEIDATAPGDGELRLAFQIPGHSGGRAAPTAQVMWTTDAHPPAAVRGWGVRFLELDRPTARSLDDFVFVHTPELPLHASR